MRGRSVCLAHGGRTPRGAASPHFTTGRHSRSLPGHLVATHERARADPTLLSLREELALVDAMIADHLRQLANDGPAAADRRVFRRIFSLIEQRRRLVGAEVRHLVLAREVLTAEEAYALLGAVVAIVARYLPDPKDRQAVAEEIHALIDGSEAAPRGARHPG